MAANPLFDFVSALALDLNRAEVHLPSFPEVVIRIRKLLEKEDVTVAQVSSAVNMDAVLVSRLLVFANSAQYNPAGVRVQSLETAIGRLGFELVKSTAISLAVRQMFLARQHKDIAPAIRSIWQKSMQHGAMATAVAGHAKLHKETAFLCGLLHRVGKLYILMRAKQYPGSFDNMEHFRGVLRDWHPKVGRCIVETWEFSEEVARTMDPTEFLHEYSHRKPTLVDAVYAASILLQYFSQGAPAPGDELPQIMRDPAFARLGIDSIDLVPLYQGYQEQLTAVREALTG